MPDPAHKRLETDTDDGMLLIISGPSGVGKTTITRGVERSINGSVFSVSCTTRDKTPADVEGLDYHFITDAEFDRMKAAGEFLETAEIYGRKYGTPRDWVLGQLERGRLVILEIDVEGAKQVKSKLPHAYSIFILPPDDQTLLQRLRDRKREDEEKILRRFRRRPARDRRGSGLRRVRPVHHQPRARRIDPHRDRPRAECPKVPTPPRLTRSG